MAVIDGSTWMELLSIEECWRRLGTRRLGRLGYLLAGEPEIVPVNYAADGRSILFRTDPGTKLAALTRQDRVAFQVDEADDGHRTGWSVLVKGTAERVTDAGARKELDGLDLEPWAVGRKDVWVRVWPETVSGRAVHTSPRS